MRDAIGGLADTDSADLGIAGSRQLSGVHRRRRAALDPS